MFSLFLAIKKNNKKVHRRDIRSQTDPCFQNKNSGCRLTGRIVEVVLLLNLNFTGIGASIAEGLTFNGMKVVTCARRLEKLEEIAKEGAFL